MTLFKRKKQNYEPLVFIQSQGQNKAQVETLRVARENYTKLANEIRQRAVVFDTLTHCAPYCMSESEIKILQKASETILKAINALFIQRVK